MIWLRRVFVWRPQLRPHRQPQLVSVAIWARPVTMAAHRLPNAHHRRRRHWTHCTHDWAVWSVMLSHVYHPPSHQFTWTVAVSMPTSSAHLFACPYYRPATTIACSKAAISTHCATAKATAIGWANVWAWPASVIIYCQRCMDVLRLVPLAQRPMGRRKKLPKQDFRTKEIWVWTFGRWVCCCRLCHKRPAHTSI